MDYFVESSNHPPIVITSLSWTHAQNPLVLSVQHAQQVHVQTHSVTWLYGGFVAAIFPHVCLTEGLFSMFVFDISPSLFSFRVVFLFKAVRSMSCLSVRTSLVATFLKLFQVSLAWQ